MKIQKRRAQWANVSEQNEWGIITAFVGDKPFVLPESGQLLLKFPDGTKESVVVQMQPVEHHQPERGRCRNEIPFVLLECHGLTFPVRLGTSGLKVARGAA